MIHIALGLGVYVVTFIIQYELNTVCCCSCLNYILSVKVLTFIRRLLFCELVKEIYLNDRSLNNENTNTIYNKSVNAIGLNGY